MRKAFLLLMGLVFACSVAVADHHEEGEAAKQQEMMKKWQEFSTPGEAHKMLAGMAGRWKYTSKMWEVKDGKPEESKGSATMKMILGGRFLQQEFKGKAMGMPFNGLGFTGFNNHKKEYESMWIDSMGTGMMRSTGKYDADAKVLKEEGKFSCPLRGESEFKSEWKIIDKNNMVFTMHGPDKNGDKTKTMEITYKRAK